MNPAAENGVGSRRQRRGADAGPRAFLEAGYTQLSGRNGFSTVLKVLRRSIASIGEA